RPAAMAEPSAPPATGLAAFWQAVRGHPLKTFLICLICLMLSATDQALYSYAMPGITREFNVGLDAVSAILSASFLAASVAVVVFGTLTDYIGRKRMFIILTAASALAVGLHALATSVGWLALFRILGFALAAGAFPISATIIVEVAPARYRGILSGWLQMSYPMGFAFAAFIASQFLEGYGWRATFYPAFAVVPIVILLGLMLKETERFARVDATGPEAKRGLREHLSEIVSPAYRSRAVISFFGTFASNLAIGGASFFLPTFLVQDRGLSEAAAASLLVLSWGIAALGYIGASYIGEFVTTRRNTVIGAQWLGAAGLAATIWLAESPTALMLGFGLSTMFFFSSECCRMPLTPEIFPTRIRTTAAAACGSAAVTSATFVAPLLIPQLVDRFGWSWAFTLTGVVPLAIAGLIFSRLENFKSGVEIEDLSR
ncbi:MAG: MFS transporter, partial [Rhodospirillaceae bacterium]|nr:MFS transporter [Rhodospirillaceae bacterium]